MKNLKKTVRSALTLVLATLMLAGLCCTSAGALSPAPTEVAPPLPINTEQESLSGLGSSGVMAEDSAPVYGSSYVPISGAVFNTPIKYDLVLESVEYNAPAASFVYQFKLSDASKIEALLEYAYPSHYIENELNNLKLHNQASHCLDQVIYSGQTQTLRQMLTPATQAKLTAEMDAYAVLNLIREQPEYTANQEVHSFVDNYLKYALGAAQLRYALSSLRCEMLDAYQYTVIDLYELITTAEEVLQSPEYQNFLKAAEPFLWRNHDADSLQRLYTAEELAEYYGTLCAATNQWWGHYITWLDAYRLQYQVPVQASFNYVA